MATERRARFRTAFYKLLPSWLTRDDGEKVFWALALIKDSFVERVRLGLEARFPSLAGPSAVKLIGADRIITRGRSESDASYVRRLKAWRYPRGHRVRGSAFALLTQVSNYFAEDGAFFCWTIDRNENKHLNDETGAQSYEYGYSWNWDGAAATPRWARFWLVLEPVPEVTCEPWPTFGEGTWGGGTLGEARDAGYCIGQQGINRADALAVKRMLRGSHAWKPAGTRAEFAVVTFVDHNLNTPPVPDGNWGNYQGRDPAYRYWNLHE